MCVAFTNMVACKLAKSLQVVQNKPQMPLELIADVSCTQHGAMIDEVLVAPRARPAGVLPPLPDIQEGDQISLPHGKPAKDILLVSHSAVVDCEYSPHCKPESQRGCGRDCEYSSHGKAAQRQCKLQLQAARSPRKLLPRTLSARHNNTNRSKWVSTGNAIWRCWFFFLGQTRSPSQDALLVKHSAAVDCEYSAAMQMYTARIVGKTQRL